MLLFTAFKFTLCKQGVVKWKCIKNKKENSAAKLNVNNETMGIEIIIETFQQNNSNNKKDFHIWLKNYNGKHEKKNKMIIIIIK